MIEWEKPGGFCKAQPSIGPDGPIEVRNRPAPCRGTSKWRG